MKNRIPKWKRKRAIRLARAERDRTVQTRATKKYYWDRHKHADKKISSLARKVLRKMVLSKRGVGMFRIKLEADLAEARRERNLKGRPHKDGRNNGRGSCRLRAR